VVTHGILQGVEPVNKEDPGEPSETTVASSDIEGGPRSRPGLLELLELALAGPVESSPPSSPDASREDGWRSAVTFFDAASHTEVNGVEPVNKEDPGEPSETTVASSDIEGPVESSPPSSPDASREDGWRSAVTFFGTDAGRWEHSLSP
jgi:hypothetical protein